MKKYNATSLLKTFIKKEKKADFISEIKEVNEEKASRFINILTEFYLIYLPVKPVSREVI